MSFNIVEFKSVPENYEKEKNGRKPNTVRVLDLWDMRFLFLSLKSPQIIRIKNTKTGETFARKITDITFWNGEFIISWKHRED